MDSSKTHYQPSSTANVICVSSKHAIHHVLLGLIILFSVIFSFLGIIIFILGIFWFLNIRSVKWILTENELIVKKGFLPWQKTYFEIPIEDIFEAYYTHGFFATIFGFGHLYVRRTDGTTSVFDEKMMKGHKEIVGHINSLIRDLKKKKSQANVYNIGPNFLVSEELYKLSSMFEKGLLTEEEFQQQKGRLLKIG